MQLLALIAAGWLGLSLPFGVFVARFIRAGDRYDGPVPARRPAGGPAARTPAPASAPTRPDVVPVLPG
jgi:hypothetical protein